MEGDREQPDRDRDAEDARVPPGDEREEGMERPERRERVEGVPERDAPLEGERHGEERRVDRDEREEDDGADAPLDGELRLRDADPGEAGGPEARRAERARARVEGEGGERDVGAREHREVARDEARLDPSERVDDRERRERDRLGGEGAPEGGGELPEDEVARRRRRDDEPLERVAVALEREGRRRRQDGDEERERREERARRERRDVAGVTPGPRRVDRERREREEGREEDRRAHGALPGAGRLVEDEEVLPGDGERPLQRARQLHWRSRLTRLA